MKEAMLFKLVYKKCPEHRFTQQNYRGPQGPEEVGVTAHGHRVSFGVKEVEVTQPHECTKPRLYV